MEAKQRASRNQTLDLDDGEVDDLQSKIAELSKPAKRAGLVKTSVLPHEAIESIEEAEEEETPDLLRDALKSYISRSDTVVIRDRS